MAPPRIRRIRVTMKTKDAAAADPVAEEEAGITTRAEAVDTRREADGEDTAPIATNTRTITPRAADTGIITRTTPIWVGMVPLRTTWDMVIRVGMETPSVVSPAWIIMECRRSSSNRHSSNSKGSNTADSPTRTLITKSPRREEHLIITAMALAATAITSREVVGSNSSPTSTNSLWDCRAPQPPRPTLALVAEPRVGGPLPGSSTGEEIGSRRTRHILLEWFFSLTTNNSSNNLDLRAFEKLLSGCVMIANARI
mmetsp:Transcript_8564/g.13953  ORF Transcript_8564/g.13953 Transcript_8564/m.13953 type:complete len:255 (+) Transcript_8564:1965-2729(+)